MSWTVLVGVVLVLGIALAAQVSRRQELEAMKRTVSDRERARRSGSAKAELQHPVVDLSRCLGCATCVAACPEDGVLEIVHGQAMVVNGARCVGVSACERECPVGAVTVTLGNLSERDDVPAISESLEAVDSPGLFLAGEVTAHALIKTAVDHGTAVGAEVARRTQSGGHEGDDVLDLCVVGAGPAGLACSLEAKRHGLDFVTLDQSPGIGGTVATYPRRKLVVTEPVDMPLYGRLKQSSYSKEELMELWQTIATEERLPIRNGEVFGGLNRTEDGSFVVRTEENTYRARNVCLALGRRGIPRKLGVPGEDLPKVLYSLIDASSYAGRRVLVVGGGDSAIEAAVALAEQPGTEVTLSYRQESFFRARTKTERRLQECLDAGRLQVLFQSQVTVVHPESVELAVVRGAGIEKLVLPNDDVFVMAGGVPPTELLTRSGVSFEHADQGAADLPTEQGTGLLRALSIGFALSLVALLWALWHRDYYALPASEQPAHVKHDYLRPSEGIGFWLGVASCVLIVTNLLYLLRRSPAVRFELGSLQTWMTSHIATGILAFLCAMLHGTMAPRNTVGGDAFWVLFALLVTGGIGRYLYAYVPRAANGSELELDEIKARLAQPVEGADPRHEKFHQRARKEVSALIEARQWKHSFFGRVVALIGGERDLRRVLGRLTRQSRVEGIPPEQLAETLRAARSAHRTALLAAHYEDVRALVNSWRYLHRWGAALMVLLVVVHVFYALAYGVAS